MDFALGAVGLAGGAAAAAVPDEEMGKEGVILLTRSSVHWAERIVAMRSWRGFLW